MDYYNRRQNKNIKMKGDKSNPEYFGIIHSNSEFNQNLTNVSTKTNIYCKNSNKISQSVDDFDLYSNSLISDNDDYDKMDINVDFGSQKDEIKLIKSDILTELDLYFIKEAQNLLLSIFKNSINYDQIRLEFICFKNSHNSESIDCAIALVLSILKYWHINNIRDGIDLLEPLLKLFLSDEDNQEDFLFWWQEYCAKSKEMTNVFVNVLKYFNELEILTFNSFENWEQQQEDSDEQQLQLFNDYKSTKNMV